MSVQVTLNIADDLYRRAEQIARRRRRDVAELLADSIALPGEMAAPAWAPAPLVDAHLARRKANGWLATHVGSVIAQQPELAQLASGALVWRFKAYLTGPQRPPQGPVGFVDIDAYSGEPVTNEEVADEIIANAAAAARSLSAADS
jgi:predicted transcriptional regulator